MSNTSTVRCRPHPGYAFFALVALGFGLFILLTPVRGEDRLFVKFPGLLFILAGLALLYWFLVARVVADANGFSWNTGLRSASVSWSEVTDYYEAPPPRNARYPRTVIETSAGKLTLWQDAWTNLPALREFVRQRASARAPGSAS